ncbi:exosortase A [Rhodoferax ferrireducens]|uniref:exosortase A n=1 Tax=Rhodoferax ferrireducens TaxID=192843 RepID=UPI000E0D26CB|nr:exosortase A [Rhodoferax ferrireducens]
MNPVATPYVFAANAHVAQPWRQALTALTSLVVWTIFLYRETGAAIVTIWARSDTFTHGFLVPPIVLWLVWRQRHAIAVQTPQPAFGSFLFIACAAFVWLLGDLAAINALTQLAFVALLVLAVPAVLGWTVTRVIIFPLGFLFFAVPIGEFLMPQLMEWTANFTVIALRLSGIPVYREGLQFVIPSGNWSVVEACSGVRYLIASLTVGTLFAYLNYQSNKRRILFVMVSIVVPVVANWMRAYIIVMLGHVSGNKLAAGVDHLIYGWLFFGVVIMLMFVIGARWAEPEKLMGESGSGFPAQKHPVTTARLWTSTVCLVALVTLPHIALWATDRGKGLDPVSFTAPTALAPSWLSVSPAVADFKPAFQNPSAEMNSSYASQGRTVGLYLGYYRHQDYSRKLVSSNNVLVTSKDPQWVLVDSGTRKVTFGGKQLALRTAELRSAALTDTAHEGRMMVFQVYWINGTLISSDYLAKAYGAFHRLLGRGDDSAVIIVYTPKDQAGGAEAVLDSFWATNYAAINELLLKTRGKK